MLENQEPESKGFLKNPLMYSTAALLVAALVIGGIFFSRWNENQRIDRNLRQEQAQKQQQSDRAALEQMGGKDLGIQSFYVAPAEIRRGEAAQLCYGVANAKTVTLDPPSSDPVWPSYDRCVNVSPKKTTTYTLTVTDAAGNTKTQTLELKVR